MAIDPSKRVMYVTMGTSLFHSATWEATDEVRDLVPGYEEWTEEERRKSPDLRMMHPLSLSIRDGLRGTLRADNAEVWAKFLPEDFKAGAPVPGSFLRYSAEMTTILKLTESRPQGSSLRDFLNSYTHIRLVCDQASEGSNLPYVAASHIRTYLNTLSDQRAEVVIVPGLSSDDPNVLLYGTSGLPGLVKKIRDTVHQSSHIDIVASGGYKIYGIILGRLLDLVGVSVGIHYLHEEGPILLSARSHPSAVGQQGHDNPLLDDVLELIGDLEVR